MHTLASPIEHMVCMQNQYYDVYATNSTLWNLFDIGPKTMSNEAAKISTKYQKSISFGRGTYRKKLLNQILFPYICVNSHRTLIIVGHRYESNSALYLLEVFFFIFGLFDLFMITLLNLSTY